jgi:hypothetical protein
MTTDEIGCLRRELEEQWTHGPERLVDAMVELGTDLDTFYGDLFQRDRSTAESLRDYDLFQMFLNASNYPYFTDTDSSLDFLCKRDIALVFAVCQLQLANAIIEFEKPRSVQEQADFRADCVQAAFAALRWGRGLH